MFVIGCCMLFASKPILILMLRPPIRRQHLYALSYCHLHHMQALPPHCCAALQKLPWCYQQCLQALRQSSILLMLNFQLPCRFCTRAA